ILKKWTSDANLLKEDVCNVLILVKLHDVPNMAFSEHGYSPIATKFGTHLMLDSYISMIELRADVELKDTIVVAIPKLVVERLSMRTVHAEYEWKSSRCSSCKVFGHVQDKCLKKIVSDVLKNLKNPIQVVRGVQVGSNLGFKTTKQVY
ncbi:putative reverse transcriptase domain-containing protein, partial [Tanacetum coccineum]